MSSLMFDIRHAIRALARAPVFTGVTVLTLALGIGANSAIFSLVNAVLIRPVGYHQPERLMMIYEGIPKPTFHDSASRRQISSIWFSTSSRSLKSAPIAIVRSSFPARANPRSSTSRR
jgi:hypothetical protein